MVFSIYKWMIWGYPHDLGHLQTSVNCGIVDQVAGTSGVPHEVPEEVPIPYGSSGGM